MIDKEKLIQWLRENYLAHIKFGLGDRAASYRHVIMELENGKFDAVEETK